MYIRITEQPLSIAEALYQIDSKKMGGIVTFSGVARPTDSSGCALSHLEYEAYQPMAEQCLAQIGDEVQARWGVKQIAILHRVGRVEIGEPSVIIVTAAEHRKEAFLACEYAIDILKKIVPIWKKEVRKTEAFSIGMPSLK